MIWGESIVEFSFKIKNDRIMQGEDLSGNTGNVNVYKCIFDIECEFPDLMWFCVFKQDDSVYRQLIEDGSCIIPYEVLTNPLPVYIGCYGTTAYEEIKRVSTNLIQFDVRPGAYSESTAPEVPEPDVWETLVGRAVPIIGENGNWFLYDLKQNKYIDTGYPSRGEGSALTKEELALIESVPQKQNIYSVISLVGADGTVIMEDNQEARLEVLPSVNDVPTLILNLPEEIPIRYISWVIFPAQEAAPSVTYGDIRWSGVDCDENGVFTPVGGVNYILQVQNIGSEEAVNLIGNVGRW